MMEAFYIDENGTGQMLEIPDNATNLTESLNSRSHGKITPGSNMKNNVNKTKRLFWISIIASLISSRCPYCINRCINRMISFS